MYNIIFDMDGVLSDSWDIVTDCLEMLKFYGSTREETMRRHDIYCNTKPDHARGQNFSKDEYAKRIAKVAMLGECLINKRPPLFDSFINELSLIRDARFAIVSSNAKIYAEEQAKHIPIRFTHVLSFEDSPSKEEKIELICRGWNQNVRNVFYITDSLADVFELEDLLPKRHIIGCSWGYSGYSRLREELPKEQIMREPKDIHSILSVIQPD